MIQAICCLPVNFQHEASVQFPWLLFEALVQ
jgi:hypothetical protein